VDDPDGSDHSECSWNFDDEDSVDSKHVAEPKHLSPPSSSRPVRIEQNQPYPAEMGRPPKSPVMQKFDDLDDSFPHKALRNSLHDELDTYSDQKFNQSNSTAIVASTSNLADDVDRGRSNHTTRRHSSFISKGSDSSPNQNHPLQNQTHHSNNSTFSNSSSFTLDRRHTHCTVDSNPGHNSFPQPNSRHKCNYFYPVPLPSQEPQSQSYFDGFKVRRRSSAVSSTSGTAVEGSAASAQISFGLGHKKMNRYRSSVGSIGGASLNSANSSGANAKGSSNRGDGTESDQGSSGNGFGDHGNASFYSLASQSHDNILHEHDKECSSRSSSGSDTYCSCSSNEGEKLTSVRNDSQHQQNGPNCQNSDPIGQHQKLSVQGRNENQDSAVEPIHEKTSQTEEQQHHQHQENIVHSKFEQERQQTMMKPPSNDATEDEIESYIERMYGNRSSYVPVGDPSEVAFDGRDSARFGTVKENSGSYLRKSHGCSCDVDCSIKQAAVTVDAAEATSFTSGIVNPNKKHETATRRNNHCITRRSSDWEDRANREVYYDGHRVRRRSSMPIEDSCEYDKYNRGRDDAIHSTIEESVRSPVVTGHEDRNIFYDGFRVRRRSSILPEDNIDSNKNETARDIASRSIDGNSITGPVANVASSAGGKVTGDVFYDGFRVRRSSLICEEGGGPQHQEFLHQYRQKKLQQEQQDEAHQDDHQHHEQPQHLKDLHNRPESHSQSQSHINHQQLKSLNINRRYPRRRASVDMSPPDLDCLTREMDALHFALGNEGLTRQNLPSSSLTIQPSPQTSFQDFETSMIPTKAPNDPFNEREDDSAYSEGDKTADRRDGLEVITSKHTLKSSQQWNNGIIGHATFRQFFLLTKSCQNSSPFDILDKEQCNAGKYYIDPFIFKNADVADNFPSELPATALDPVELSAFCCPEGVKVRLIPRAAVTGAKRLGWIGQKSYEFKVLAFTDGNGATTHGIAITVSDEVSPQSKKMQEFATEIKTYRTKRAAAQRIRRWWHNLQESREDTFTVDTTSSKRASWSAISTIIKASRRMSMSSRSFFGDEDEQSVDSTFDIGKIFQENFSSSVATRSSRRFSRASQTMKASRTSSLQRFSDSDDESDSASAASGFLDWSGNTHFDASISSQRRSRKSSLRKGSSRRISFDDTISEATPTDKAAKLGRESFEAMNKATDLGDMLVIEKCYVVLGGKQSQQFIHFRILQNMIQKEHEEHKRIMIENEEKDKLRAITPAIKIQAVLKFVGLDHKVAAEKKILEFRHKYLRALQTSPMRSCTQYELSSKSSERTKDTSQSLEFELPTFSTKTTKIIVPPSLPHVAIHWGVAALFARIKASELIHVLKLLLIERSVLVVGQSSDLVTACACAFLELLKPYEWASNFMPLLPTNMIGFVNSPVPFLIGMVVDSKQDTIDLENDGHVIQARAEGLTIVNLSTRTVRFTTEPEIVETIEGCPTPITQVTSIQKKFKPIFKKSTSLKSFPSFIAGGLSRTELSTIDAIRRVIFEYLKGLAGNIAKNPFGWKSYGKYNDAMDTFDFYPSLFVDSLKKQLQLLTFRLQYLEMMAYSQLFVEFVDVQRRTSLAQSAAKKTIGKMVRDWKRRRSSLCSESSLLDLRTTSSQLLEEF